MINGQNNIWQFHNPVQINFGRGCRAKLVEELQGKSLLIVSTKRGQMQFLNDPILGLLSKRCELHWVNSIVENPGVKDLHFEINRLQKRPIPDAVIAFGGGSSLDAGKIINLMLTDEYIEYSLISLLKNSTLKEISRPRPLYALATTSGTGSEVTPFATIWDHVLKKKHSIYGSAVYPFAAYVDPDLRDSLPLEVIISSGLDAINQAAESIWNKRANSFTLLLACHALFLGFAALPKLVNEQGGRVEHDQMAEASLMAGLAISHTRTALCHSISYPITAYYGVPHGLACAFTMPAVLRHNLKGDDGRFKALCQYLTGDTNIDRLLDLFDDMHTKLLVRERVHKNIPDLDALLELEPQMSMQGRIENNLVPVSNIKSILKNAWGEKI